jgi:hypothetical protein
MSITTRLRTQTDTDVVTLPLTLINHLIPKRSFPAETASTHSSSPP